MLECITACPPGTALSSSTQWCVSTALQTAIWLSLIAAAIIAGIALIILAICAIIIRKKRAAYREKHHNAGAKYDVVLKKQIKPNQFKATARDTMVQKGKIAMPRIGVQKTTNSPVRTIGKD
jgi:hypothetical protein